MKFSRTGLFLVASMLGVSMIGSACSGEEASGEVDRTAHELDGDECAACGMIVREQPAPRAQLVHRDGERAFFCSIGDMVAYRAGPSPHGEVVATYVEVLPADADPALNDPARRPWVEAQTAGFVLGVARHQIMGEPVLVYATHDEAELAATRYGGRAVEPAELQTEILRHLQE